MSECEIEGVHCVCKHALPRGSGGKFPQKLFVLSPNNVCMLCILGYYFDTLVYSFLCCNLL